MVASNLLQGSKVRLTALSAGDLATLARWYQDAGFLRLFDARPAYPRDEAALARWLEEQHKDPNTFIFAVRLLDSDELVGYVVLDGIEWSNQAGWLAIGIGDRRNWGQGYGYEAMRLILAFAFHELNLHRVQLTAFSYNERAIALYERLGFQREGVFREFVQRDGRCYDMYLYGLLRREWEALSGQ